MNKTVLIIDDDNILRNTLTKGLRSDGFNVLSVPSAESGNEILSKISVDAIILDRMMTGMDGLTFLHKLRASGNKTPVIMLTAMTGPENTIDGLSGGANDYLAKPFQMRELVLRLNNIIPHSAMPSSQLPSGLTLVDNEFFIQKDNTTTVLALSGEEKRLLQNLTWPMGNIAPASPMVAKRLRSKLNVVLSDLDIITIRGQGYKLICKQKSPGNKNGI